MFLIVNVAAQTFFVWANFQENPTRFVKYAEANYTQSESFVFWSKLFAGEGEFWTICERTPSSICFMLVSRSYMLSKYEYRRMATLHQFIVWKSGISIVYSFDRVNRLGYRHLSY